MREVYIMTGVWVFLSFLLLQGCLCTKKINFGSKDLTILKSLLRELKDQSQQEPQGNLFPDNENDNDVDDEGTDNSQGGENVDNGGSDDSQGPPPSQMFRVLRAGPMDDDNDPMGDENEDNEGTDDSQGPPSQTFRVLRGGPMDDDNDPMGDNNDDNDPLGVENDDNDPMGDENEDNEGSDDSQGPPSQTFRVLRAGPMDDDNDPMGDNNDDNDPLGDENDDNDPMGDENEDNEGSDDSQGPPSQTYRVLRAGPMDDDNDPMGDNNDDNDPMGGENEDNEGTDDSQGPPSQTYRVLRAGPMDDDNDPMGDNNDDNDPMGGENEDNEGTDDSQGPPSQTFRVLRAGPMDDDNDPMGDNNDDSDPMGGENEDNEGSDDSQGPPSQTFRVLRGGPMDDDNGHENEDNEGSDDSQGPPSQTYRVLRAGPMDDDNDPMGDKNDDNNPMEGENEDNEGSDDSQGPLPSQAYRDLNLRGKTSRKGPGKGEKPDGSLLGRTCPILKEILPTYFDDFPEGNFTNKIDYSNVEQEAKEFIKQVFTINRLLKNPKIVAEDSTQMLARYILDKRVQCPATKLQQAMLYIVDKLLETQFEMEDGSLKMNLSRILENVKFPTDTEKENLLNGIVWGLHHVLFREFNDEFAVKEFLPLEKYLRRFMKVLPKFLTMNNGETELFITLMKMKRKYVRAYSCTPPKTIFKIHTMAMQKFMKRYEEEEALGVLAKEGQIILNEIFQFIPVDQRNKVVGNILVVLKNYVVDLIEKATSYESLLATKLYKHDVHGFIFQVLSSQEQTYLRNLLQHLGFIGTEPLTPTDMPGTDMPTNMPPMTGSTGQPSTILPSVTSNKTFTTDTPVTTDAPEPSMRFFKSYKDVNQKSDFASSNPSDFASGDMDLGSGFASGDMDLRSDFASGDMDLRSDFASGDMDLRSDFASGDMDLRSDFASSDMDLKSDFASGDMDLNSDFASGDMELRSDFASGDMELRSDFASTNRDLDDEPYDPW